MEKDLKLFSTPFTDDVECVSNEFRLELLDLQCDPFLKENYTKVDMPKFYKFLPSEKYLRLFNSFLQILAVFGSIYICKQLFSAIKINKSFLRSRLTGTHLQSVLQLANVKRLKPSWTAWLP